MSCWVQCLRSTLKSDTVSKFEAGAPGNPNWSVSPTCVHSVMLVKDQDYKVRLLALSTLVRVGKNAPIDCNQWAHPLLGARNAPINWWRYFSLQRGVLSLHEWWVLGSASGLVRRWISRQLLGAFHCN